LLMNRPAFASWDADLFKLTSAIKCQAGLFGLDGEQWAGQMSLRVPASEIKIILAGFAKPVAIFGSWPMLQGVKYMCTRADHTLILAKHGADGFVAMKGVQTATVCKFNEGDVTPAQAEAAVQKFVAYLAELGF
jgi:profilin